MAGPITVASNVLLSGNLQTPYQRRVWHVNGRRWICYRYGNSNYIRRVHVRSSLDGITWGSPIDAIADQQPIEGLHSALLYQGSCSGAVDEVGNLHVCQNPHLLSAERYVKYHKGLCNADGTITWATADLKRACNTPGEAEVIPAILTDSNGYPWVAARRADYGASTSYAGYIDGSSAKTGAWTSRVGMPRDLTGLFITRYIGVTACALSSGKVLLVWMLPGVGYYIHCDLWDGAAWGGVEDLGLAIAPQVNAYHLGVARIGTTDNALILWVHTDGGNDKIVCRKRFADGTLDPLQVVHTFSGTTTRYIAYTSGNIAAIWQDAGKIYGRLYSNGAGTWTGVQTLLDVAEAGVIVETFTASLNDMKGKVLLTWNVLNGAQWDVRYMEAQLFPAGCISNTNAKMRMMAKV